MSFARRAVMVVLVIQFLVIAREILFEIGWDRFLGLIGTEPIFLLVALIAIADLALLVPVSRGNRWATLATVPLMVLLLLAALPIWMFVFGSPTEENFSVWFTLTVGVVASLVGVPFGVIATLESFGRRPGRTTPGPGFSPSSLFVASVVAAVCGMAIVAVAVAASPTDGGSAFDEAPDAYASMSMRDLRFAPSDLRIDGDRTTAVFVTNDDSFDHSFDIDAMDIHVQIAAGQTKVVMLSPASGETLELYCAVPGHRDGGMVGTVIGR